MFSIDLFCTKIVSFCIIIRFKLIALRQKCGQFVFATIVFSKKIALLPSPGYFPIDFDEICQNIVTFDPADAFSGPEPPPLAFHEGNTVFSNEIAPLPSPEAQCSLCGMFFLCRVGGPA